MRGWPLATCVALVAASGEAQQAAPRTPAPAAADAPPDAHTDDQRQTEDAPGDQGPAGAASADPAGLSAAHRPKLSLQIQPERGVKTGEVVRVLVTADAAQGDDVTVPEQDLGQFEIVDKSVRIEPAAGGRQRFNFRLDLLALSPGEARIPALELRVVTSDGVVGSVSTEPRPLAVGSHLGNEPNAKLKPPTKPVAVIQDDYTLLWALGLAAGAALVVLMTLLGARWWRRRARPPPSAPPPAPPWETATRKLQRLRLDKARYLEGDRAAEFVDRTSDVVRDYLGARYCFEGLESTSDEVIEKLDSNPGQGALLQDVVPFLHRCDLVKFAKAEPDADEADLVLAKAFDIVRFRTPDSNQDARQATAAPQSGEASTKGPSDGPPPGAGPEPGEAGGTSHDQSGSP